VPSDTLQAMTWLSDITAWLTPSHSNAPVQTVVPDPPQSRELCLSTEWQSDIGVMLHIHDEHVHAGKLAYAVCERCRLGHVLKVSVYAGYDRSGVARALIQLLLAAFPDLTWYTSWQQPTAVGFWQRMAEDTGQPLVERKRCDHRHSTERDLPKVLGRFNVRGRS
jgi:hypothetical protein